MAPTSQSPAMSTLNNELREIKLQSKPIRIWHCVKNFVHWRSTGISPNEMRIAYKLSYRDMYATILDSVQAETGIDRNDLLLCPGRGRGHHDTVARRARSEEEITEAEELIALCQELIEQAEAMLKIIKNTIDTKEEKV